MDKMKAALIATGFMPKDMDAFEAVEKLAAMGYKGYEMIMFAMGMDMATGKSKYTMDEAVAKIREVGMEPLTTVFSIGDPRRPLDITELIKQNHDYNIGRATCMGGPITNYRFGSVDEPRGYDDCMRDVEELEKVAAALKKEGIVVCYHNHDIEFTTCFKGVPYYYLMAANTDDLKFELDTGWATYGGFDPVQLMNQLGDRLCAVHIKDFADGFRMGSNYGSREVSMPIFTTPGTGNLKLKEVLATACKMGIDYAIIEQDYMRNLDPLATAQAGYYNMKETGYVE